MNNAQAASTRRITTAGHDNRRNACWLVFAFITPAFVDTMGFMRRCMARMAIGSSRLILLAASILLFGSLAVPTQAAGFAKNYSGLLGDFTLVRASAVDGSGNTYIVGSFSDDSVAFGAATVTRIGAMDAFAAKIDANGTVLWAKNFGGAGATGVALGIAVDVAGNVYLSGYFQSANLTTPALTKIGFQDAFAIKLDSSGNTTWAKNFGGANAASQGLGIAIDGSGNVYLSGYVSSANLTTPALTRIGNSDAIAIKLDSSGTTTWAKNFGGAGAIAQAKGIAVDGSGNVHLSGYLQSANLTTPPLTKIGANDAFAIKLDPSGTTTWAKNYGGAGATAQGMGIAVDGSGNVYLGGNFSGASLTTPALTKIGTQDSFAIKLDSSGTTTWANNYGGAGANAQANAIAVDGLSNVYLAGQFFGASLSTPALTIIGANNDAYTIKLDSSGSTTWAKNFGGAGAGTQGNGLAVDSSGNVYLGGSFQIANLTSPALTKIGFTDAYVVKLDSSGNTTWSRNYGGGSSANSSMRILATAVDASGNTYFAGFTSSDYMTLAGVTLTKIGTQDVIVAKLDATGTALWFKRIGGSGATLTPVGIAVDSAGNVYLGGSFSGANLTTPALTKIGAYDSFAIKFDSSGNTTWAKNFGGAAADFWAYGIAVDGTGNVYLGGFFRSANATTPPLTRIGSEDAFAIKLDSSGNTTWAKNFGGATAAARGQAVAVDGSGNVYLGGFFYNASLTTPAMTVIGNFDPMAIKLDASGNTIWAKNFGGVGATGRGTGIAVDGSGNVYLGGHWYGADLTTPALTRIGFRDSFAIKLDSGGTTSWAKNFGGSDVQATGIAVDGSGSTYVGGYFLSGNLTTPALTKIGSQDAFAIKLNSSGTTSWAKNFGGPSADVQAFAIAADSNANVYLGGMFQTASMTTPALTKLGSQDGVIIKQSTTLGAPVIGAATGGNTQASVTFGAPLDDGGFPVTGYTVTSSPAGGVDSNAGSTGLSHVMTGLVNGTAYTFTVTASNANGTSAASAASNSVTPLTVPTATTMAASSITTTGAILNGTVNDNGASTAVSFDYGLTTGYGSNVAATTGATVAANAGSTAVAVTLSGLTCNTTYHFRVNGVNSAGTTNGSDLTFTTPVCVVNGVCGSTHGATVAFAPTANLCSAGSASGVTAGSGAYGWSCAGSNGGATAVCSASGQNTGSGGGGTATVATNGWTFAPQGNGPLQSAGFIPVSGHPKSPPGLPPNVSFPYGLYDFVLNIGTVGSSAVITITYPGALPAGAVYWKYGPTPAGFNCAGAGCAAPHWYQFPAVLAGNTATLTIVDGGVGDDDLVANGTIVDQGGPGFSLVEIPTLSEWARMLLAGMLAMFGILAVRRKIR